MRRDGETVGLAQHCVTIAGALPIIASVSSSAWVRGLDCGLTADRLDEGHAMPSSSLRVANGSREGLMARV